MAGVGAGAGARASDQHGSNRLFQAAGLYWFAPKFVGLWCKPRRLKTTIWWWQALARVRVRALPTSMDARGDCVLVLDQVCFPDVYPSNRCDFQTRVCVVHGMCFCCGRVVVGARASDQHGLYSFN